MASTSGTFQCHIRFHRRSRSFLLLRWSSLNGWAASFFVVPWQWWRRTAAEPQRSPGFQVSFSFHRRFIIWAYEVFEAFACARFQHYFLIQFEHLESPNSNCRYRNRKSWQVLFFREMIRFVVRGPRIVIPSALANWLSARWEPRTQIFCGPG